MNDRQRRIEECQEVEQAARDEALRAFETARAAYHGALRSLSRSEKTLTGAGRRLAEDLDRTEDACIRLGMDPWEPAAMNRLRQLAARDARHQ